jgi:hypothetical protein
VYGWPVGSPRAASATRSRCRNFTDAVRAGLEQVLTPERLDEVLRGLADEFASQADAHAVQRAGFGADLATVEGELKNLAAALAGGAAVATVLDAIKEREARRRELRARLDALDAEQQAAGLVSRTEHLAALRTICRDWKTLLKADPVHGRRVLRDLRIERVVVRRDDQGRWSYKLVGVLDKLLGEKFYAVTDEPFAAWIDEPDDVVEPVDQEAQDSCPRGDSNTRHAV